MDCLTSASAKSGPAENTESPALTLAVRGKLGGWICGDIPNTDSINTVI